MIKSMTGFGRREVRRDESVFTIEIRSVNNRYLDVQIKTPRVLSVLEPRIRKAVQDRFSRGRFDVFINWSDTEERGSRFVLDQERAARYIDVLTELKNRFSLPGEIDLRLIAGAQDIVIVSEVKEDVEELWNLLSGGLSETIEELSRMRIEEGAAMSRDIAGRLESIEHIVSDIRALSPQTIEAARKRLADVLRKILAEQPDPARIAQEIAILAERADITEELTRMDSHMKQFRIMLVNTGNEAIGRKLDFMIQELGREVNTIASKAMNAEISYGAVTIKAELEKIREQVQNIE